MLQDLSSGGGLYLTVAAVVAILLIAQRVPLLRTLISVTLTIACVAMLVVVLGQRERFDPYLGRFAALLDPERQEVVGPELRVAMSADGHFWVRARIDGVERRLLVDSGATTTALSTDTATAAGLAVEQPLVSVLLRTANGIVRPQTGAIGELRLGNIVARDVPVVVSPAFGDTSVLGMNFLSRLKSWRVEGRTLILTPHHPQETAG